MEQQIAPLTGAVRELIEGQRRTDEWRRRHEGTHDVLLERGKARRNEVAAERLDWTERRRR